MRWRRRFEVAANFGSEKTASVRLKGQFFYPDLILSTTEGVRRRNDLVEVETAETINHLEAMAQWSHYAKVKGSFFLYVPIGFADIAGRLCQQSKINVTEIWTYYFVGSQVRFTMSYRSPRATLAAKAKSKSKVQSNAKVGVKKKASKPSSASKRSRAKNVAKTRKSAKEKTTTKRKKTSLAKSSSAKRTKKAIANRKK
jgi:hypothetical protein